MREVREEKRRKMVSNASVMSEKKVIIFGMCHAIACHLPLPAAHTCTLPFALLPCHHTHCIFVCHQKRERSVMMRERRGLREEKA